MKTIYNEYDNNDARHAKLIEIAAMERLSRQAMAQHREKQSSRIYQWLRAHWQWNIHNRAAASRLQTSKSADRPISKAV